MAPQQDPTPDDIIIDGKIWTWDSDQNKYVNTGENAPSGNDGGGSSSSGGGSSGGGNPASGYRELLFGLQLAPGSFQGLISEAVQGHYGREEFLAALGTDPHFQDMFPGINHLMKQGMSLPSAVAEWRGLAETYRETAEGMGLGHLARLNTERVGFLIKDGVDAAEFGFRLQMLDLAKNTQSYRENFNRVLSKYGHNKLDDVGWYRFIMGHADSRIYDLYEATALLQELRGEGLKVSEAKLIARAVGPPEGLGPGFKPDDFAAAYADVQQRFGTQVLADAGLNAREISLALLEQNVTTPVAQKKAQLARKKLEQLQRNVQGVETGTENIATMQTQSGRPTTSTALLP